MTSPRSAHCPSYDHLINKPNTKSPVWVHFGLPANEIGIVIDDALAICKLCLRSVAAKGGSTSNMSSHLKIYYPLQFRELTSLASNSNAVSFRNADAPPPVTAGATCPASTSIKDTCKRQKTMLDFQPLDSSSTRGCTQAITEFLGTCMQPYNMVEHNKFINMINVLNPRYKLPGRKYFSSTGVPKLYNDTVEKIKRELFRVDETEFAITTDCWTSVANTPFLAVTVHYISPEWELKNVCLSCKHFEADHTSENISNMLIDTLSEWGIDIKKISCSTTDNGTNILKAVRELGVKHISCFAHNINIGVNRALQVNQLKKAVARLKSLQNSVAHGWKMRRDLGRAQDLLQMANVNLPSACPTRWWSTVKLCRRFLENQLPICKMLMDYPSKKHLMLEGHEISAVQDFVTATTFLEEMTKTLSGSGYTTASSVLPLYMQIKKNLQPGEGNSGLLRKIKFEILNALALKYESESMMPILSFSTLCDPRFRLRFLDAHASVKEEAIKKMADFYDSHLMATVETLPSSKVEKHGLAKFFDLEVDDEETASDGLTSISIRKAETELGNYLAMPRVDFNENPLVWWKTHEASFPLLRVLARQYLAIPGTSVPSESVFSTAGNVITKHRASLLPKNAEMQIFLAKNKDFV